ncbi:MAG: U32 family peptidase [Candidatus Syntropharchaeia archaeon]
MISVAHPGYIEALERIASECKGIGEIFMEGSPDYIRTGRIGLTHPDIENISEQVWFAHEKGIKVNVLANSSCLGGDHLSPDGYKRYRWYFERLNEIGVDSITLTDPYFIELVSREFDMKVVVSCIAFVDSPQKAIFYEELGANVITIDTGINRNFDVLQGIRESTECELRILVNEGCLYSCPFRFFHYNLISHGALSDYYHDRCLSMRIRNPELIIKSGWIRPEDLREYEKIGIDSFKISGRTHPLNWLVSTANAYIRRSYHGNLLNLLDCPRDLRDLFYIENDLLDGAIERWKECKKLCIKCGFCTDLAKRVIRTRKWR